MAHLLECRELPCNDMRPRLQRSAGEKARNVGSAMCLVEPSTITIRRGAMPANPFAKRVHVADEGLADETKRLHRAFPGLPFAHAARALQDDRDDPQGGRVARG